MGSGKVGVSTSIIINTRYRRNRKPRPSNCNKCKFVRVVDGTSYCMISGNLNPKKKTCKYYSGPVIQAPPKYKKKATKKAKSRPEKSNS